MSYFLETFGFLPKSNSSLVKLVRNALRARNALRGLFQLACVGGKLDEVASQQEAAQQQGRQVASAVSALTCQVAGSANMGGRLDALRATQEEGAEKVIPPHHPPTHPHPPKKTHTLSPCSVRHTLSRPISPSIVDLTSPKEIKAAARFHIMRTNGNSIPNQFEQKAELYRGNS